MKKFNPKLQMYRKRRELFQNSVEQPRNKKASYWNDRRRTTAGRKNEANLSEDVDDAIVMQLVL